MGAVRRQKGIDPGRGQRSFDRLGDRPAGDGRRGPVRLHASARPARRRATAQSPPRVACSPTRARTPSSWCRWTSPTTSRFAAVMDRAAAEFGKIDFLLHAIAFASMDDLKRDTIETSRGGFLMAMEISAYSLIAVCNAARGILNDRAAIATMTYFGGEKAVPGYNVMGICKAALDVDRQVPGLRPGSARHSRQRASARARCARWPAAARASKTCCGCTRRWPRWAATSRTKKSAAPARFCSRRCPTASPAKSCTSTAATTSWARPGRLLDAVQEMSRRSQAPPAAHRNRDRGRRARRADF